MSIIACSTSVRCGSGFEEALASISSAGFRFVDILAIDGWVHVPTSELITEHSLAQQINRTKQLLVQYNLQPVATNSGVSPQLHDRSAEAITCRKAETAGLMQWMKALNINIAAIQPRQPDRSRPWEEVLGDCIASLREQLEIAKAEGIQMALEFHVNSPFETMEQCLHLMELMPEMPIVYDPTHFVMQGVPLEETFVFLDRAVHVHLRDAANDQMQVRFGAGAVDFERILIELKRRGYQGGFSIEYLQTDQFDVMEDAVQLYARIKEAFPAVTM
ncbi:sugar phosphate isomerase/epimerase [Paenibacillus sp. CF384]|uniref:sugar phosphate isomerase/epimerase family protein n=1 Tax=Paenibacillus sp. CF384 TaxID=1884382 RepID=UPI00089A5705|nr:sugar phosphate isomerase/epimerase [Paenibacillus sp. CF384]SDX62031.1 Sugar phosphate isomerase/epimerase [Paenibacillus sp. CF384]